MFVSKDFIKFGSLCKKYGADPETKEMIYILGLTVE